MIGDGDGGFLVDLALVDAGDADKRAAVGAAGEEDGSVAAGALASKDHAGRGDFQTALDRVSALFEQHCAAESTLIQWEGRDFADCALDARGLIAVAAGDTDSNGHI